MKFYQLFKYMQEITSQKPKITLPHDTFLQKLLSNNYKYFFIFQYYAKSTTSGIYGFLLGQFSDIIQNLSIAYIWILNNASPQIITYLIIGRTYKAISDTFFAEILGPDISTGQITKHLMIPQNYIHFSIFRELGRRVVFNLTRALSYGFILIIYAGFIDWSHFSLVKIALLIPLLPISFLSTFFLEFLVGTQAFFVRDKRNFSGIHRAYNGISGVLSGILIPLDKLPFYNVIQFLPTSWLLHHPMQIYLGKYDTFQTILVFFGGISWCILLYFLAKLVFKLGLKRNESVGL